MIIQASSVKGSSKALRYQADDKGLSVEICRNGLLGDDPNDWHKQMLVYENFNHRSRCENKRISVVLSPSKMYSKDMTLSDWEQMVQSYLNKMNIKSENHSYIAHFHQSTNDFHVHLTISRFNFQAQNKIADNRIGMRSGIVADQIAKENAWKTTIELSEEKRNDIGNSLRNCLKTATNISQLSYQMKLRGYELQFVENQAKGIYGMRIVPIIDINENPSNRAIRSKQGYKLSEIQKFPNRKAKFKIVDIHKSLQRNYFNSLSTKEKVEFANNKNMKLFGVANVNGADSSFNSETSQKVLEKKEGVIEAVAEVVLKPNYVDPRQDDELTRKKKKKSR